MSAVRMLSLSEAATYTGLSRVTIRRYLDAGRFKGAIRDLDAPRSPWKVPTSDLRGLGCASDDAADSPSDIGPPDAVRERLAAAVALADERERTIAVLERALALAHETIRALAARACEEDGWPASNA